MSRHLVECNVVHEEVQVERNMAESTDELHCVNVAQNTAECTKEVHNRFCVFSFLTFCVEKIY